MALSGKRRHERKTAADIQNALLKVVEDPKGTARGARIEGKRIAGKTGTAEIKAKQGEKEKKRIFRRL